MIGTEMNVEDPSLAKILKNAVKTDEPPLLEMCGGRLLDLPEDNQTLFPFKVWAREATNSVD